MQRVEFVTIFFILFIMIADAGCSLFYINAVRNKVEITEGENRDQILTRFGKPVSSTPLSDTFRIRGRYYYDNDNNREISAMTAFTLGLGELVVFPYILVDETAGAVTDSFCLTVKYHSEEKVKGYVLGKNC